MPEYVKFLQDLLETLQQLENISKVVLNEQCSEIIMEIIPTKM